MKKIVMVLGLALVMIAALVIPVSAGSGDIVPPDEYFTAYYGCGPNCGGTGLDAVPIIITESQRFEYFSGNFYMNGVYPLGESHEMVDMLNYKRFAYPHAYTDHPYEPPMPEPEPFTSEDPTKSTYEPARHSMVFRV